MTITRHVSGYTRDSALPGIQNPSDFTLGDSGSAVSTTLYGAGSVPVATLQSGVTVEERGDGVLHQTVFTLVSTSLTITDHTAAGAHGSIKLYDFPAGLIHFLGGSTNLTTLAGAGGVTDTAALVGSVGSVTTATDNATLTTTEADFIPSTTGTLTAGAGTLLGKATASQIAVFDGTATAPDAYLNVAIPDAGCSANDTLAVSGTITLTWINHGDN
jgi:hypothetical protein